MLKDLALAAQALSDPTRLRIIKLLAMRDLCVCQLVYLLGATQSRVSQNLALLKYAGLVTDTRRGKLVFYALNQEAFAQMASALQQLVGERSLADLPEMSDEDARWRDFPADLPAVLCDEPPAAGDGEPVQPETAWSQVANFDNTTGRS